MATRPPRFLFAIKRRRSKETKKVLPECSLPSRILSYKSDDTLKTPFQFHQMLPGGRWLITGNSASDDSVGQICCWDLHNLSRPPAVHALRHPIAIFDGFEGAKSAVICQASPEDQTVVIMVRSCSADGEYDVDIVKLSWTVGDHEEVSPTLWHFNRICPKDVYIEGAHLDGDIACFGSGRDWIFWNWREDTAAIVTLPGAMGENTVHILLRQDAFFTISRDGYIYMFPMPNLGPLSVGHSAAPSYQPAPSAMSTSYGTVRHCTTLDEWIPSRYRARNLVCLKTTMIPSSYNEALEARVFPSCCASLLDYSLNTDAVPAEMTPTDVPGLAGNPLLPRLVYFGRGSMDLRAVFDLASGFLLERTVRFRPPPTQPSRHIPILWLDFHHMLNSAEDAKRRRVAPFPGTVNVETSQYVDPATEEEFRLGLSVCYTSGRVLLVRPRIRTIEVFDFD